jgi:nitrate/nitrite transport system substrate-binding protein
VEDEAALLTQVYRTDIYRLAADIMSSAYPLVNTMPVSGGTAPWILRAASQPIAMGSNHIALSALETP